MNAKLEKINIDQFYEEGKDGNSKVLYEVVKA